MRFLAIAPLIFDQFVIARRSLQRRPAIIVCRWVRDLRLNLGDWPYPLTWFVHCGISQISANVVGDEFHGRIDVFIVQLVLLLVHLQQRPQDAFYPSHAQRVQTRVHQYGIGFSSLLAFGCYLLF